MNKLRYYTIPREERQAVCDRLCDALKEREEIIFAYVHGSFLSGPFRDIDIGVYVRDPQVTDIKWEFSMERGLEERISYPVDLRVLNSAPLSFHYSVIRQGFLLFSRDENVRTDVETATILRYLDFSYFRDSYRREALGLGV